MEQTQDKTQEATPHRRQQAREEGQVAQSQDLAATLVLLAGLLLLLWSGGSLVDYLSRLLVMQIVEAPSAEADTQWLVSWTWGHLFELGKALWPMFGLLLVAAIGGHLAQTGFLWAPQRIEFDPTRLDPLRGFGRIFSLANGVRLVMGLAKMGVVAGVAAVSLLNDRDAILGLAGLSTPAIALALAEILMATSLRIVGALFVLALADYAYQWWQHERDLRMTPQEVREEMKNLQGDPQTTARRRQVQRQLVLNRLSAAVPKADVVVTNPTELAIAIQYDAETMKAPVVVAKGAGLLAKRIRDLAAQHSIPILERKPLAQALYKEVDVNRPIPAALYTAVAEVLAYVYQLKGRKPLRRAS